MKGFTLVEIMLVVSLMVIVGTISVPVYQTVQLQNDLDLAISSITQTLHRAQILSQGSDGDSTWGARVSSGSVILFKGTTYASRDPLYDEVFEISPNLVISSSGFVSPTSPELIFSKMLGEPTPYGTITLTTVSNQAKNIVINPKGMTE
ncbi:MAG: hypothetical protein US30_C0007G0047 [Candidatus Moranbacteria bacterium GW2011_GWF2_36_839]|nr:MAG: hypothetical protein US27_C0007G0003 [Candidatus Moranbacteria bacterium GW2011_GWF1_36_78]KKQ17101.1 MAG: hypothetical protein US30_C0007G0047 [Candidatus Moranbacteria bacterium GW2011_GWF2_36_839]HAT73705.1 hypothetical protein [Candidatus Moranbacteria bacterium]HBY11320.1 hypothetical protein [Candidatus Moranbacteria bacterium]